MLSLKSTIYIILAMFINFYEFKKMRNKNKRNIIKKIKK